MTGPTGFLLTDLAGLVDAELVGSAEGRRVQRMASLASASSDELAFCTGARRNALLQETGAGAVIVKRDQVEAAPCPALIVDDPYYAYARLAQYMHPPRPVSATVHKTAVVAASARLGSGVSVGPYAVIEEGAELGSGAVVGAHGYIGPSAVVGADSRLFANVTIGERCRLGERVIAHSGAVVGADGFGFAPAQGRWHKVPQLGCVIVGDDVEIGANTTIDRGALDDTVIEEGVKLDNLVHIAHNVRIGAHTVFAGGTVVAGSSSIGRNCMIGGLSAITGHVEIADGVTLMGMTGVPGHIREPGIYASPLPAQPVKQWRRNAVRFTQLDELARRVKELERAAENEQAQPLKKAQS